MTSELSTLASRCGFWAAARHACKQGVPFDVAYVLMFGRMPKPPITHVELRKIDVDKYHPWEVTLP